MKWIDTSDLDNWSKKVDSKHQLPLLISRLIRATTLNLKDLQIPKGTGIYRGGWDGRVESQVETEFVPNGQSYWEFGTASNYKSKVEKDFDNRTVVPDEIKRNATIILVTPKIWEKSNEWVSKKMNAECWKKILVYDGSKLIEWLSIAPVESLWLAKEIGKVLDMGMEGLDDYWETWKTGPSYNLNEDVVLADRETEQNALIEFLQTAPSSMSIQSSTKDEAIAFIAASVNQTDQPEVFLARALVIWSDDAMKTIMNSYSNLIIILKEQRTELVNRAVKKGHHVLLPRENGENKTGIFQLSLPSIGNIGFVQGLKKCSLSENRAKHLCSITGGRLSVFRRIEGFDSSTPNWATGENCRNLIPALLAGSWDESKDGDKLILSALADQPYDEYIAKISKWKFAEGSPITQIGKVWNIVAPIDAWNFLARYLINADTVKFSKIGRAHV